MSDGCPGMQGFVCPAESNQYCDTRLPNPAGSNLGYKYQGFDNFAMMSLVVFQVCTRTPSPRPGGMSVHNTLPVSLSQRHTVVKKAYISMYPAVYCGFDNRELDSCGDTKSSRGQPF